LKQVPSHLILIAGSLFMIAPVVIIFLSSTHPGSVLGVSGLQFTWGGQFADNYGYVLNNLIGNSKSLSASIMIMNSMITAGGIAIGGMIVSLLTAYAIVYFRFRFGRLIFWLTFVTLLLPLETRIVPTYAVIADLSLLDSYSGLIFPLLASGLGTFLFHQYLKSVPDELLEAARIDGAGPIKFLFDILLPISKPMIAAIVIILFINGWNQYLWPIIITTDENFYTMMLGIRQVGRMSSIGLALTFIALLPPVLLLLFFQRWFVDGLTEGRH
jgi:sn-glycerol 3-phosphate transport system permease protein